MIIILPSGFWKESKSSLKSRTSNASLDQTEGAKEEHDMYKASESDPKKINFDEEIKK